jgi:hypothetical protein
VRPSGIVLILPYKVECSRQGKKLAFDFLKSKARSRGRGGVGGRRYARSSWTAIAMVAIGAAPEALVRAADDTFTNLTVGTPLWQPTACHRLERIFWVHSPKAASSFSITVCATSSPSCVCCTWLSERDTYFCLPLVHNPDHASRNLAVDSCRIISNSVFHVCSASQKQQSLIVAAGQDAVRRSDHT